MTTAAPMKNLKERISVPSTNIKIKSQKTTIVINKVSDSESETSADPIIELFDTSWHMKPSMISLKAGLSAKKKSRK